MIDFLIKLLEGIGLFMQANAITLIWIALILYIIHILRKSSDGSKWLQAQFEWLKGFFYDDDDVIHSPNHKNLILFALVAVFCAAYLKKVVTATDLPDVPGGWQLVLLAGLGINQAKSAAQKFFENKFGNGNGNGNGKTVVDTKKTIS